MKKLINISILLLTISLWNGCSLEEPDQKSSPDVPLNSGTANFTTYVALGNSLTAGYQSAALTEIHQNMSYVNLIAGQMGKTEAHFVQPLLGYPGVGTYNPLGGGIIELNGFDADGNPILEPAPLNGFNPNNPYISNDIRTYPAPYNNLGIPGIVLADLDSAISATNSYSHSPFIDIVLRNPNFQNTNPIKQAMLLNPTFISCWIGNNDVLGYATSGGVSPGAPTPSAVFSALYANMISKLTSGGAEIVVANIPDVTSIPFFTTIVYKQPVPGVADLITIYINTGSGARYATENDLILLTAMNVLGDVSGQYGPAGVPVGFHTSAPLPSQFVLDEAEVAVARTAVEEFNAAISSIAASNLIPVVDINALLLDASDEDGYKIAGLELSSDFISGGLFSYDGVHPSDLGHVVVANEFITSINSAYGSNIPTIDVLQYLEDSQPIEITSQTMRMPSLEGVVELFGGKLP